MVEEHSHFHDFFGELWVAVMADDETVVWLCPREQNDEQKQMWEFVIQQGAGSVTELATPSPPRNRSAGIYPFKHPFELFDSDAKLMSEYCAPKLDQKGEKLLAYFGRDWNDEYQSLVEQLVFDRASGGVGDEKHTQVIREKLNALALDFTNEVDEAITTIVKEMFSSQSKRTIPSAKVGTYFHNNIMYRVSIDTAGGAFGGDANAMKCASTAVRTHDMIANIAPLSCLSVPLSCLMTYVGYRVTATAIAPILPPEQSAVAGSIDGTRKRVSSEPQIAVRLMDSLGQALNLKRHAVGEATTQLPLDAAVHAGLDGRLYIMNMKRGLPPLSPPPPSGSSTPTSIQAAPYFPATSSLFRRLRPEIVTTLVAPCNPDAFVPDASTAEDNEEIITCTSWIREDTIPTVAAILGFLEPCPAGVAPNTKCTGCGKSISSDEIRFVVCHHEKNCCCICIQCDVDLVKLIVHEEKVDQGAKKMMSMVKCGTLPRQLKGFIMVPDVTSIFHANGLNMRFLAYVYAQIATSARPCTAHYLEVEIIARAAKHLLWKALRRTTNEEDIKDVCCTFFFSLLHPTGEQAERFWAEELGPAIQSQFEVFVAFDTAALDMELCYRRVSELTGIELTEESVATFTDPDADVFVQLKQPRSVMKWMRLPHLTDVAGAPGATLLNLYKDELQEFWTQRLGGVETCPQHLR